MNSTSTDYTGRKKDLNIFGKVDPHNSNPQVITLGTGRVSSFCAGIQKLIQRFSIMFLTELGSQPAYPNFGTEFMSSLRSSNMVPKDELVHYFNFANLKVLAEMKQYQQQNNDPLDEQIATAILNNVVVLGDSVNFNIAIQTMAGESVQFIIPLPL